MLNRIAGESRKSEAGFQSKVGNLEGFNPNWKISREYRKSLNSLLGYDGYFMQNCYLSIDSINVDLFCYSLKLIILLLMVFAVKLRVDVSSFKIEISLLATSMWKFFEIEIPTKFSSKDWPA